MELGTIIILAIWGAFAASVILRLRRRGSDTFDDRFEGRDRKLVGAVGFYLAVPVLVLFSQLVQVLLFEMSEAGRGAISSWVYWGIVSPAHPELISAYELAAIAAAGPATLMLFVLGAILWTKRAPATAAHNFLRLEVARVTMSLALGVHPIASLITEEGDFWTIRTALNELAAPAGDAALLVAGVCGALSFWFWRGARRLRQLGTTSHDVTARARAQLTGTPDDPSALRTLGAAQLAAGDNKALETLERARRAAPEDPHTELLIGQAMLSRGEAQMASSHLRTAGQLLDEEEDADEPLLFEVTLALSAARMMLGDAEGAILTAEVAREVRPADPRALLMVADALVAGGRRDEARDRLTTALTGAEGLVRREIERRLAALRRR